ncbi:hypothetical protein E4U55_005463, partial [Claviceps digitariae]
RRIANGGMDEVRKEDLWEFVWQMLNFYDESAATKEIPTSLYKHVLGLGKNRGQGDAIFVTPTALDVPGVEADISWSLSDEMDSWKGAYRSGLEGLEVLRIANKPPDKLMLMIQGDL